MVLSNTVTSKIPTKLRMDRACNPAPSCKICDAIEIGAMRKKRNQSTNSSGLRLQAALLTH